MKSVSVFFGVMAGGVASGKSLFGAKYLHIGKIQWPLRTVDDPPTYFHLLYTEGKYSGMMTSKKTFKDEGEVQSVDLNSPVMCAKCESTGMSFYDCPTVEYDKNKYTGVAIVSSDAADFVLEKVGKQLPLANGFLMFEKSSCKVTRKGDIGIKVKTTHTKKTKRYLIHKQVQTPKRQQPDLSIILFGQRAKGATTLIPLVVDYKKVNVLRSYGERYNTTHLGAENWEDLKYPLKGTAAYDELKNETRYVVLKKDDAGLYFEKWEPQDRSSYGEFKAVIHLHEFHRLKDVNRHSFTIEFKESEAYRVKSPVLNVFLAPSYVDGNRLKPVQAKPSPPPAPAVVGSPAEA